MASELVLRPPRDSDGMAVHRLIEACPPLDVNSAYCNLLQCGHFSSTSVIAELDGAAVGFISGYRLPQQPHTLFIWQVAVSEKGRGQGLAGRMLAHILDRDGNRDINYLETTITRDNKASWALFEGLARKRNARVRQSVMFDHELHFERSHDTEMLVRIGPLERQALRAVAR